MIITFRDDMKAPGVIDFLLGPRLFVRDADYPDFKDWLERIEPELVSGTKRHLACWWNRELVGLVVWQRHKKNSGWTEIKNLTVRPVASGRMVGSFLLRQAEIEGRDEFGSTHSVCDAKKSNLDVAAFLTSRRYKLVGTDDLYGLKAGADLLFARSLR